MTMSKDKKPRKPITAAELMAQLNQDPDFVRRREEKERHFRALQEQLAKAERPLVAALSYVGVMVESVWDLVNTRKEYKQAIPVLIAHLERPYPWRIREGIARALTVKYAGEDWYTALVREFRKLPDSSDPDQHGFKWALGNAISYVANKSHYDDLAGLARDRVHGQSRDMIVRRLPKLDRERSADVLVDLLGDDDVAWFALQGLAKLKVQAPRLEIERLLNHPDPWVRKEATKALAKPGE